MSGVDELEPVEGNDGRLVKRYEVYHTNDDYPFARVFLDTIPSRNKCIVEWYTTRSVVGFLDSAEEFVDQTEVYGQFTKPHPNHSGDTFTGTLQGVRSHQWFPDHYSYLEMPFDEYFGGVAWTTGDTPQIVVSIEEDSIAPLLELFDETFWGCEHLPDDVLTEIRATIEEIIDKDWDN